MAVRIVVRYPTKGRRLRLRTGLDWSRDLEAESVGEGGDEATFHVDTEENWFEFKVLLVERDGSVHWSAGSNYLAQAAVAATLEVYPHFFTGTTGRVSETFEIAGKVGAEPHRMRAYVPPCYDENPLKRFPVVYMHDGTNLFFPQEAFLGRTWDVHHCLDLLDRVNAVDPICVVGIQPTDREDEYTAPGYEEYGRFLVEAVKATADTYARTLPGPENTLVLGSSLGGVVSLHCALAFPDVFGGAACLSSTFGYKDDLFERVAKEPKSRKGKPRIYLDSGWPKDNSEKTMAMRDALLHRGWHWGSDLLHFVFPGERHEEGSWATRLHIPLQFFFHRDLSEA